MVSSLEIRRAHASAKDAAVIQQVEHAALGDSSYSQARILQLLRNRAHFPYLAWVANVPVGFCWCFETPFAVSKRLEIDLLGVLPSFRRQGIAAAMIQKAHSEAQQRGIAAFRSIVARDNLASQHAFIKAGMHSAPEPVELLVYSLQQRTPEFTPPEKVSWRIVREPDGREGLAISPEIMSVELQSNAKLVASAQCLLVETLVYRGVWIEGLQGAEEDIVHLVRGLFAWCAQQRLDEVGILCSHDALTQAGQYEALWRAGLASWGHFYVFS